MFDDFSRIVSYIYMCVCVSYSNMVSGFLSFPYRCVKTFRDSLTIRSESCTSSSSFRTCWALTWWELRSWPPKGHRELSMKQWVIHGLSFWISHGEKKTQILQYKKWLKKCGFNQQKMTFIAFFERANLRETSHSAPLQGLIFPYSMLENSGGSTYKGYRWL